MANKFKIYLAGGKPLESEKTLIMGILNATPDSFSDGGELADKKLIEKRVKEMLGSGADILDVGGESTRPGHKRISEKEELNRVLPVVRIIRAISKTVPISIDTRKPAVARAALESGASLINDISALGDKNMAGVANSFGCSVILMRNQALGKNAVEDCRQQFKKIIYSAEKQGIAKDHLVLDPGLGFGDLKSDDYKALPGPDYKTNMLLVLSVQQYSLGLPIVIGGSRKRFVATLGSGEAAKDRLAGSVAVAVMAEEAGAAIVRVHDVAETAKALNKL
jgi:dihydropteroate synthase